MTLAQLNVFESPAPGQLCSCCGAKLTTALLHSHTQQIINENFLTVKGAAVFLPRGNDSSPSLVQNKHTGDIQLHLQTMFTLLRPEDTIRLAVRLESAYPQCSRYMVVVSTNGRQETEESVVLGMDFTSLNDLCTLGLVLPLWSDTLIHLDGDGGFSVSTADRVHVFKPVSVQAMWSALQSLHKACEVARCHNYYPGSLFLMWVSYYQSQICSEQHCINEWNAMQDVQSHRATSPMMFTDVPTERERTEQLIKSCLREIMMQKDLENVTSKEIRTELETQMVCNLREFKEFIDNEMIVILGQMDSPTEIFDHVFLGSEWNASNLEELQSSGVRYILNVTREIDNFFPGLFEYHNIRVYDEEATNLLEYWNDTWKFISKAKKAGAKCLVHCKMGVSRSASTVIAYAMKEYGWDLDRAFEHVKERRSVTKPNPSFMKQLEEYQGILLASKQRHNKLWRSHSDSNLSEQRETLCKGPRTLGHSNLHNKHQNLKNSSPPPIQNIHCITVQQTLNEPQPNADNPYSRISNSQCKSNVKNLHSEQSYEQPLLPPLPLPQAAVVVPEQNMAESCVLKVAVTVPITCTQPPPSLHVLTPFICTSVHIAKLPHARHEPKTFEPSLDMSHHNDSCQISQSTRTLSLTLYLDTVRTVSTTSKAEDNLASPGTSMTISPMGDPLVFRLLSNADSDCDFIIAKFLRLQNGQLSKVAAPRAVYTLCLDEMSSATEEECCSPPENSCDSVVLVTASPHHHDSGVSVRHMITSLESISSARRPQHHPPLHELEELEKKESLLLPPSTSAPLCEQTVGSVRHATEQLELSLQQGSIPTRSPLQLLCLTSPNLQPTSVQTVDCTDSFHTTEGQVDRLLDDKNSGMILDLCNSLSTYHKVSASAVTVNPSLEPSSASSYLLWLEGATELQSDINDPLRPTGHLAHSSQDLQKIQETLRELQTFLYVAGGLSNQAEPKKQLERSQVKTEQRTEPKASAVWQRAMEIETRLRQAGLAPPSLMKRSASLAKLDQLELSMHDLNDWDSHPAAQGLEAPLSSLFHSHSHSLTHCPDDAHKKQRFLPQTTSSPLPAAHPLETNTTEGSINSVFSHLQHRQENRAEHVSALPTVSTCTRQQQHAKPHLARRLRKAADKKKTVTVLYNTM